ncbi:monosaccharide ABC transporter ATP-binding protein (CUT2 family) [Gibbsiella quercinecans]|uniref:ABC transporter ATP-binding protein n=1 Tax=Gibbsiella quercinecans TaxID=929813 RepID=A0A250B8A7_9GAMM|nr:sugar ABC transporter ATP-binding protein [Gibbsiella quercinecans]ATA22316.1 ABC transporter ATP-binding protein [Gibbsiella quercinecans]RLM08700.1 ABC transporter ATP-binding protein [Gibbsiella quercinecans]RLM14554.1 ABC transporter ATP-binding protein [Gibbsiella quercinecans]TCT91053.1 monosaccharide ABC transporter ATP-binding protein (CUT2 family) [Gibbsiella quercinecans]
MLEFKNVGKTFPGVIALQNINLQIKPGEIVGLVGENGAGKSTLMKIIYGAYQHDSGEVLIDGKPVVLRTPREAMMKGIGMVFQEQSLIANLTVMENIFLGFEQPFKTLGVINWKRMAKAARQQLAKVKLDIDPKTITAELSFTQRQLVELAKVLTLEERSDGQLIILLDEPTSVLPAKEIDILFDLVRELTSRASFIFVSHRMDEVINLADRIYVMKDGQIMDMVTRDKFDVAAIQRKMVGRDIDQRYFREHRKVAYNAEKLLLELKNISLPGHYSNISLRLHAGEVLALVGTEGAGTEEIIRTVFGLAQPEQGEVTIYGKPVKSFSPAYSISRGVGYIPRERKVEGIVEGMSVAENITLANLHDYARAGVLAVNTERRLAQEWVRKLAVKTASIDTQCGKLSGGNQQKVVLAKWRTAGATIILLDHPTRGLDIGAKEDVYDLVRDFTDEQCGVLLIADSLEEAIGLAHTIIVFKDGKRMQQFDCCGANPPGQYDLLQHIV